MSETQPATTADLGVVDPLRIPGAQRVRDAWKRLPLLGRAFVLVAVVDFLLRASGLVGLQSYIHLDSPISILTGFLPHSAMVLFPVVLLARRRDAATAMPRLLRGAVIVALVELASSSLVLWLAPIGGPITVWAVLQVSISVAAGVAYVALATGLQSAEQAPPTPSVAGLANLVAGLIAGAAIIAGIVQLTRPNDLGDPGWTALATLSSIVAQLSLIAFAYLARTILRGASDRRRPREARILAATAMLLSGIDAFLTMSVGVLVLAQDALHVSIPVAAGGFVLALLGSGFVMFLVVVAFGLGLGDTSGRIRE